MNAIRKIIKVEHASIHFDELAEYNNQDVEVIVFPLSNKQNNKMLKNILDFSGIIASGYIDTSENIDELIYGQ